MTSVIPEMKYKELINACPDQSQFFFDKQGRLNEFGKTALFKLEMEKVISEGKFAFDAANEALVFLIKKTIPVSSEASDIALQNVATEFLEKMGINFVPTITVV